MLITTEETVTKYETWSYEIDGELPDGFDDWNGEDKASWLAKNTYDATLINSEWAGIGTIDEYRVED